MLEISLEWLQLFHWYWYPCTFILVPAIIRQTRWPRNAWWLAKANLRPGLQVELIVLIKKTKSFLYLCSSSICMYYILMYWVSKQMTRNRWIMVRSALFFCRNERADAHLPRFQGVGLHIIIYCLSLLGSARSILQSEPINMRILFKQYICINRPFRE